MFFRVNLLLAVLWGMTNFSLAELEAKPSAPVSISYQGTAAAKTGAIVVTQIELIAQSDLETLSVSVAPLEGLRLLSNPAETMFDDLRRGDRRFIEVEIELTDPEIGYLSVFATTVSAHGTSTKTIAIPYGKAGTLTKQKMKSSPKKSKQGHSQDLILMPASPR